MDARFSAWNQWVRVAIEIKFWQVWGKHLSFHGDRAKLDQYAEKARGEGRRFSGICLVFCHRGADIEGSVAKGGIEWNPSELAIREHGVVAWAITP